MTKINVEIDIDELFSSKDKVDALGDAINKAMSSWSGRGSVNIKEALCDAIVRNSDLEGVNQFLDKHMLDKINADPDMIKSITKDYKVAATLKELVDDALRKHADTIEKQVVATMMSEGFVKNITGRVERSLESRMTDVLDITHSCDCED